MNRYFSFSVARVITTAAALAGGLSAFSSPGFAQGVATLSGTGGNSCTYTSVTTLPNGNITVACGAAANSATITIGTVGSLDAGLPDTASVPVACAGTGCNGVAISVVVSPAVAGIDVIGTATHNYSGASTQTFNVGGTAPATGTTQATVVVTVTSQGMAATTTPDLNGTVSKNIAIVNSTAAGTLSFSPPLASVTEGAAPVNVSVLRTGSGAQASDVSVAYSCSTLPAGYAPGITPAASGTLSWTGNDATAKTITINPTTVPDTVAGTVTCTLGATTGGAIADTTQFVLTVNKAGAGSSCVTTADQNLDLSTNPSASRVTATGFGTRTSATKVSITRSYVTGQTGQLSQVGLSHATGYTTALGVQFNVSECPGDFTTSMGPGCGATFSTRMPYTIRFTTVGTTGYCNVDPTKKYYINTRFVNPTSGASTCPSGTCGLYVNLYY